MDDRTDERWVRSATDRLRTDERFLARIEHLDTRVRFDVGDAACVLAFDDGAPAVVDSAGELEYVSWDVAVRGDAAAWRELLEPIPAPGYTDVLAAWLNGNLRVEGDLEAAVRCLGPLRSLVETAREVARE